MKNKYEDNEQCEECENEEIDPSTILPLMLGGMPQSNPLMDNGILFLTGAVTEKTAEQLMKILWAYHFDDNFVDPIHLIINSPGGRADCMWALMDTMAAIKNEIYTIAMGDVISAGFMIFIAGDHRTMSENAIAMAHNFSGGAMGNYPELIASRKGHDLEYKRGIEHLIRNSKYKSEKQVKEHILKDQDNWLSPDEMLEMGLIDDIFRKPKRKKKK